MAIPKVGDQIYVATHLYIDHGEDDVIGGLATIVSIDPKDGSHLTVAEHPGYVYNWRSLEREQEQLKKQYDDKRAYPQPDLG